jgi:hypothetical protein
VKRVAEEFGKAASRYPEALALCLEFAGKAIPPEEYQKYCYGEKESWGAVVIQGVMANVCGGPETIRRMSKEVFVPNAVEEADTVLKRGEQETEADMLRLRAGDADPFLDFVRWADPENATLKELQAKQNALREKAKALYAAEVKGNRVSPDRYGGGDAAALKQAMKQAFRLEGQFTIVRVTITSGDWREQAHVWSGINALDVGWYRLIDGAIVVKLANGTCWVHPVTFGKRWTGTGDKYGELAVYNWADRYEILPANVNQ